MQSSGGRLDVEDLKRGGVQQGTPSRPKTEAQSFPYTKTIPNPQDWCISRQLWWGHRIPVWYVHDSQDAAESAEAGRAERYVVARNEAEAARKAEEQFGAGKVRWGGARWVTLGLVPCLACVPAESCLQHSHKSHKDLTKHAFNQSHTAPNPPPQVLVQEGDVLDTWFSSGLWPFSTLGWPAEGAADLKAFYPTQVGIGG
jgi:valyl-tRNA synthetase